MRKFLGFTYITLIAVLALGQSQVLLATPNVDPGKPGLPSLKTAKELLNKGFGAPAQLGTQTVSHKVQVVKGSWSVLKSGGASVVLPSTVLANLMDEDGKDFQIPYHAIIKQVTLDVISNPAASTATGFSATQIGLGIDAPGDLYPYTVPSAFPKGLLAGVPVGTVATMHKVGLNANSNRQGSTVKLNMKNGSLVSAGQSTVLSGQIDVFIEYYLSD